MYFKSIIKNLFKVNNIGTIAFFVLNAGVIISVFYSLGTEPLICVIVIYLLSVVFALSPFGDGFMSVFAGARTMKRIDMRNKIEPILVNVYNKALKVTPELPNNIILKVVYDPNPNAFAIGRRTICISEGLLELPDDMIEGVLAHEIGHLALHHTDIQLLIGGGNFIITIFMAILKVISDIMVGAFSISTIKSKSLNESCLFSIITIFTVGTVYIWTKFCMLFLMWSSRGNEFEADKYAFELGYGYELASVLDSIGEMYPSSSFFKALYSSHPDVNDRIAKLQELGVPYTKY